MIAGKSIRSVLVAVRLSQDSADLVRAAADIALATGAKLHVVHALEDTSILAGKSDEDVQRQLQARRLKLLGAVIGVTGKNVDLASVHVHRGPAAEVILEEAEELVPDLIVLGPHRDRAITDGIGGTTGERVLRGSSIPCLVLNGPLALPLPGMVVAIEMSDHARHVEGTSLRWAEWLSRADGARVTFASVTKEDGTGESVRAAGTELRIRTAAARRRAEWDGTVVSKVLIGDDPVNEILTFARDVDTGMVVAGTTALSPVANALLGGFISTMVRRSNLPVLLVPPHSSASDAPMSVPPRRRRRLVAM